MEQEERRMQTRMKELKVQMREEFQMKEEAKVDNVNCNPLQLKGMIELKTSL